MAVRAALFALLSPVYAPPPSIRPHRCRLHTTKHKMRSRVTTSTARTSTSTLLAVAYRPAAHTATALPLSGPRFVRALATTTTVDGGKQRKKLVVLGNGWAGYRLILDVDISKYELSVISPRNYFLFTPLLTSTTVGTLEFRGVIEPVRTARPGLNYIQAGATSVDTTNKVVTFESVYEERETDEEVPVHPAASIKYDELVIAVGAAPNTFGVPGVEKYCYFLKSVADARNIRQRIIECFERASSPTTTEAERSRLLHFVIVGGGPTSVEFSAELHDFLRKDVHKIYPDLEKQVQITLIEAGKTLLSTFDQRLSDYTMRTFRKRNIDVRTSVSVKQVKRHEMVLSDGAVIPFGLGVWSTGLSPIPFIKGLPFPKDRSGRLLVDEYLHVKAPDVEGVYAVGDCAAFETNPLPATAQGAEQEGKYLAQALNAKARGEEPKKFQYHHKGMLAYVGGYRALIDSPLIKRSGFLTWIMWNAAYITKLVSIKNKMMIPMYWFKSFVFGRDISRF